jgi:hypothetical protein
MGFIRLDSKLVSQIFEEYVLKMGQSIDTQGVRQIHELKASSDILTQALGDACASSLYNFDIATLEITLKYFLQLPGLTAAMVGDDGGGAPSVAGWKSGQDTGEKRNQSVPRSHSLKRTVSRNRRQAPLQ